MRTLSLRSHLILTLGLPLLIVSWVLAVYFSYTHYHLLENQLKERGLTLTRQMALHTAYLLNLQGDTSNINLRFLGERILDEEDVRSFSLYDNQKRHLLHTGPSMHAISGAQGVDLWPLHPKWLTTKESLRLRYPLFEHTLLSNPTYTPNAHHNRPILGWLEVELSMTSAQLSQYQMLLFNIGLTLFIFVTACLLAWSLINKVIAPLQHLIRILERIKNQEFNVRIADDAYPISEIRLLAQNMNQALDQLQGERENIRQDLDVTHSDLNSTLEKMEIQNIELDLALKRAQEANRVKTEFLASMSHEIRTPLNAIIGFGRMLQRTRLDTNQSEYLNNITQASESLLLIINDILDLSRLEAGKVFLEELPINLRELVDDVLAMLAPDAQRKQLEMIVILYEDVPQEVIGDPARIRQILTNLVTNAVKFTAAGQIIIRITLEDTLEQEILLRISVSDTGKGLSQEQKSQLFQAFHQADISNAREYGGSGLGLAICKGLVEQMGGSIEVESELHKGSTFWFTVKVGLAPESSVLYDPNLQGVLALIEPNPMACHAWQHLAQGWGLGIQIYEDMQEVLEAADDLAVLNPPLLAVLISLSLEQAQAPEVHEEIRQLVQKDIAILVLVNSSDTLILKQLTHLGVVEVLSKPCSQRRLYTALAKLNGPPSLHQQTQTHHSKSLSHKQHIAILAVDDNAHNLQLVSTLLRQLGVQVYEATHGREALQKVQQYQVDLVFMDVRMPGMDGIEATQRIRALGRRFRELPIVALTAHALAGERQKMLSAGMTDYLIKPISEAELLAVIRRWTGSELSFGDLTEPHRPAKPTPQKLQPSEPYTLDLDAEEDAFSPVDIALGVSLAAGKLDLAQDMLEALLTSLPERWQTIQEAYLAQQKETLLDEVHKLHGITRYCGVPNLGQVVEALETRLKAQAQPSVEDLMQQLEQEVQRLITWYQAHQPLSLANLLEHS